MVLRRHDGRREADRGLRRLRRGRRGLSVDADATYLARACELAPRAVAAASPNPPVGCVVARDGVTLGEGWHHRCGEAHAEAEALREAQERGHPDVRGATAYVSLEPCNHHGRTPPCTEALIGAGVTRVVVGALDPDPRTAGGGVRRLHDAGIRVDLTETPEARGLVERFAWTARTELPFVTLKMAMSVDGFIAPHGGITHSLTGSQARERVRELRIDHDAVMVGAGTVRIDDPRLTVRPHATRRKPYVRVVACESAPIAPTARVLATPQEAPPDAYARTIVLAPAGARDRFAPLESIADVAYAGSADAHVLDLGAALRVLRARGVATVLCEGGPTLAARLLAARLVQRIVWLIAPVLLRSDAAIPVLSGGAVGPYAGWRFDRTERLGDDMLLSANIECSPG